MSLAKPQKSERIDIRTTSTAKHLIQQAAIASHKSISEFLLEHGLAAAEQTLADRRSFTLNTEQWQAFQQALDSPPQPKPNLEKLLTQASVFDE